MVKKLTGTAYFMRNARRIEDLENYTKGCMRKQINPKPYIVKKVIVLNKTDFLNFSQDLLVGRQFIEDNIHLMAFPDNDVWHCILVAEKGVGDTGILVVSDNDRPVFTAFAIFE